MGKEYKQLGIDERSTIAVGLGQGLREDGSKDFKSFSHSADAIRRHTTASRYVASREPVSVTDKEETIIIASQMFRASTRDAREAIKLVTEGKAEVLRPEIHYRPGVIIANVDEL